MRFTTRTDGGSRATFTVSFALDRSAVAEALTLHCLNLVTDEDPSNPLEYSRARIEEICRERLKVNGPPDQWVEYGPDMPGYDDLRTLCETVVSNHWGTEPQRPTA